MYTSIFLNAKYNGSYQTQLGIQNLIFTLITRAVYFDAKWDNGQKKYFVTQLSQFFSWHLSALLSCCQLQAEHLIQPAVYMTQGIFWKQII